MVSKIGDFVETLQVLRQEYVKAFNELDGELEKIWKEMKEGPQSDPLSKPIIANENASKVAYSYMKFWYFPFKVVYAASKVLEAYMGGEEKLLAQALSLEQTVTALHLRVNEGERQLQKTEGVINRSFAINEEALKALATLQKEEVLLLQSIKKLFPELSKVDDVTTAISEKLTGLGTSNEYRARFLQSYERITKAIAEIQAHILKQGGDGAWAHPVATAGYV